MPKKIMYPPVYFFIFLGLIILVGYYDPWTKVLPREFMFLRAGIVVFGSLVSVWAIAQFSRHKTTVVPFQEPSKLVKSGLFRVSRNPMYLGMVFVLLGSVFIARSLITFIIPFVFAFVITNKFIIHEEKVMEEKFGEEYREYKKKVGRWI